MGPTWTSTEKWPIDNWNCFIKFREMALWNFKFIGSKWKMAHNPGLPSYNTDTVLFYESAHKISHQK